MTERTVDMIITGGTVVSPESSMAADIAVDGGVIVAVGAAETMPPARETVDAAGMHILPGIIDSHVHFREPGYEYKEDWKSGTAAAACGGVTSVFEMPNTHPPTGTVEELARKQEIAARSAHVDYGIYGLLDENNLDQLEPLAKNGAAGFKCFMGNTFGNLPAPSDGAMLEGFEILAGLGKRCVVHAENWSIMARREAQLKEAGRTDPLAHLAARPAVCAMEAVSRATIFAEWTGARLHIAHKSSGDGLHFVRDAKARGVDVTVETCPQYLLLSSDDMAEKGGIMRVNPPVREPGHAEALWEGLLDGTVDMLATDHAPHQPEEKTQANIWNCDCGFPGVETAVPLMLTQVNAGRMTINQYVRWSSVNPAKAWGLYPRKGAIQAGADADFAIVDLGRTQTIDQERLHSKSHIAPWHGHDVKGVPVYTIVRGRIVSRDGELVGEPGWGRPVPQEMPPATPRNVDNTSRAIVRTRLAAE
jgi:dihydroorotase